MKVENPGEDFSYLSFLFTLTAVALGIVFASRTFRKKKGRYHSGLSRETPLSKMSTYIVKVEPEKDQDSKVTGSFYVRGAEGSINPANDLIDYRSLKPPFWGTDPDHIAPCLKSNKGMASHAHRTVMQLFQKSVQRCPNKLALKSCDGKEWTWTQYYNEVIMAACSFVSLGLKEAESINILGFNCPEWLILNCGAIASGGIPAGVYTTNLTEACHFIASHSKAKVIAVENVKQLEKYIPIINLKETLMSQPQQNKLLR